MSAALCDRSWNAQCSGPRVWVSCAYADINECALNHNDYDVNAEYINTDGSFGCQCTPQAGYKGDGKTCIDVDECSTGTHSCSAQAM
uniref:NOTCH1 EGF-like calcium-binding domain-containing protein n=1 Tax=Chromera velia CCMP2878 TaxID=1169474 RepID=A0A0G4HNA1_9ALVE|eukprot:Cvel_29390.t1-p1 / transcript=Cvel_29390.t1 / gene=Cvel_29390 / organism=Chromera_velia_CCMP2878 / gene_product=Fibrillin-1, putative / transcript_product=Fibrillin-1, putative / location=Cvel_scaffold4008:6044-6301(+) / protein_length=86 / sequence_SO=supercontig / SO=protein_coding / is_pseudo=false